MEYKWMSDYMNEVAEVRAVARRTKARLATQRARQASAKKQRAAKAAVLVLRLYRDLSQQPMTIEQTITDYNVSRRTVYNWLKTIDDSGAMLHADRAPEGFGRTQQWRVLS